MKVIVQRHACGAFDSKTGEVDVDTVLPILSWLGDKWLAYLFKIAGKLIDTNGIRVFADIFVEERITEASCVIGLAC